MAKQSPRLAAALNQRFVRLGYRTRPLAQASPTTSPGSSFCWRRGWWVARAIGASTPGVATGIGAGSRAAWVKTAGCRRQLLQVAGS
jgi:hypothetical protein